MIDAGFPACPGEIMVRNPAWSKPLQALVRRRPRLGAAPRRAGADERRHLLRRGRRSPATPTLLERAKAYLFDLLAGQRGVPCPLRRARSTCSTRRSGFFCDLRHREAAPHKDQLDLKKGGIFPLMHGVRALALERRLVETNTIQRIRRLQALGMLRQGAWASSWPTPSTSCWACASRPGWRRCGCTSRWTISSGPDDVGKLERDLLKDSLQIVKQLKEVVRHHFRLAMF